MKCKYWKKCSNFEQDECTEEISCGLKDNYKGANKNVSE